MHAAAFGQEPQDVCHRVNLWTKCITANIALGHTRSVHYLGIELKQAVSVKNQITPELKCDTLTISASKTRHCCTTYSGVGCISGVEVRATN
uniref:Uncharacterized protein n=1 Tax=Trichogramma kaykai TaxID=54128 RepID=A0ABD2X8X7_9HYME